MKTGIIQIGLVLVLSMGLICCGSGGGGSFPAVSSGIMADIPTGCFDMGDAFSEGYTNELPVHYVCVSGFSMDVHEVTNSEYKECVDAGECGAPLDNRSMTRLSYYGNAKYDDFPVVYVNWSRAVAYCAWEGKRLPTEAEWEYAARGGLSGKRYPMGDTMIGTDANYMDSGDPWDDDTSRVEHYATNGYGLYDMAGNVAEWVADWYGQDYYSTSPTNNPQGPATGMMYVIRGASWNNGISLQRVAYRYYGWPVFSGDDIGFRCVQ